jgi:hypothetical protein
VHFPTSWHRNVSIPKKYRTLNTRIWSEAGIAQSVWCLSTEWMTGVRFPEEVKDFSSILCADQIWGPPSIPPNLYQVKARQGPESRPITQSSAEIKMSRTITPLLLGTRLVIAGDLYFTFYMNMIRNQNRYRFHVVIMKVHCLKMFQNIWEQQ